MAINETVLEISLKALTHNYNYLKSQLQPQTKMLGVVKAFSYGSDSVIVAKKLEELGADFLAVAYTKEGIRLRKNGIRLPILVLHPLSFNFKKLIENCLTPNIYNKQTLQDFIETCEELKQENYPIHLKINTGLNRLGFDLDELDWVLEQLAKTETVRVEGIFSHLAASEDENEREFTLQQISNYKKALDKILPHLDRKPIRHLCNTSGILNYPEAHFDMVRTGIGLYGFGNSAAYDKNLKPIGSLKTIVSQIHHLKEGESVGYNRAFKAEKPTVTATLPLGHADGINRIYGNQKTKVEVNGKLAPIIGNVCMDMIMIDVTGIDCKVGDEVTFFSTDKSAEEFAGNAGTISYELITSISQRVKRKIIE